jgi:acyl-CoA thioester hydrolase
VEARRDYPHLLRLQTRWLDNDVYGHVNNVVYYALFDTVINRWLIEQGGLDILGGEALGVCAESHCRFREGFSFPESVDAGLRVAELKTRSVRYEIGIFREGAEAPAATGWFVHVFVDRATRRPTAIPDGIREALKRLLPGRAA